MLLDKWLRLNHEAARFGHLLSYHLSPVLMSVSFVDAPNLPKVHFRRVTRMHQCFQRQLPYSRSRMSMAYGRESVRPLVPFMVEEGHKTPVVPRWSKPNC